MPDRKYQPIIRTVIRGMISKSDKISALEKNISNLAVAIEKTED